jgi:actin-related protein
LLYREHLTVGAPGFCDDEEGAGCPPFNKESLFTCVEMMFTPQLLHKDPKCAIQNVIHDVIAQCIDTRRELYGNIVLTGGNTSFRGFAERLKKELKLLAPSTMPIDVVGAPKYAAWIGGSLIGEQEWFPDMAMSKAGYDESGPGLVHGKCPPY